MGGEGREQNRKNFVVGKKMLEEEKKTEKEKGENIWRRKIFFGGEEKL